MQLSNTDIKAIEKIRQMVECGIFQPMPIKQLCSCAYMGRTKLMQGFFHLYHTTIYRYRLTIAMEYAKALLEDGKSVKEVGILLGYKTPGHFSRAFTKVFPGRPGSFKREGKA